MIDDKITKESALIEKALAGCVWLCILMHACALVFLVHHFGIWYFSEFASNSSSDRLVTDGTEILVCLFCGICSFIFIRLFVSDRPAFDKKASNWVFAFLFVGLFAFMTVGFAAAIRVHGIESADAAGWMQTIGVFIAIGASGLLAVWQYGKSVDQLHESRRNEQLVTLQAILALTYDFRHQVHIETRSFGSSDTWKTTRAAFDTPGPFR